ncbi:MAG: hypothetical protein AB1Z23_09650 [Eubacteriales bacterium]
MKHIKEKITLLMLIIFVLMPVAFADVGDSNITPDAADVGGVGTILDTAEPTYTNATSFTEQPETPKQEYNYDDLKSEKTAIIENEFSIEKIVIHFYIICFLLITARL